MNRLKAIQKIRQNLKNSGNSIGSWMQIPNSSVAEIMGHSGYDWVAVDMEHGSISVHQLPDLFRALELGNTLPLARVAQGEIKDCKQALDAGAGGVIVPMVENAEQLKKVSNAVRWPPAGTRGVAFSRSNLFGKYFDSYIEEAQQPLLIAMIENISAVDNLESILSVDGLDAILIGIYDLSASMNLTAKFDHPSFINIMDRINKTCEKLKIPCGVHIVEPDVITLNKRLNEGYRFIAYSIDSVFLEHYARIPKIKQESR
jgi:2-dehydro-3-deoxyglucarate aldolase